MADVTQIQVRRKAFGETRIVTLPLAPIGAGEILVDVDRFALTANNVSYALSGDMVGYWKFFPAEDPWGIVPVWGFGNVVQSNHADIAAGERLWGFWPMADRIIMTPGKIRADEFTDIADHRQALPGIYNSYRRTGSDPAELKAIEDLRSLLFPLFMTSYILYDFLVDNQFFGAEQILVGSASSKTGLGLVDLLARHPAPRPRVVGLTSPGNVDFVRALGTTDEIVTYDAIPQMNGAVPTAFIDMSGHGLVVAAVHARFGANLKHSSAVGATHWDSGRFRPQPGGPAHDFFFAPTQFAKRTADWGPGEVFRRAQTECIRMARALEPRLTIRPAKGAAAIAGAFQDLVGGQMPPHIAIIGSLKSQIPAAVLP